MKVHFKFLHGVLLAIIIPIALLIIFIIFSNHNMLDLVENDYYQKELNYQSQIDRETRTNKLEQNVIIYIEDKIVTFQFPSIFSPEKINGEIIFFRPSNSNNDFNTPISLNKFGIQSIGTESIPEGVWIIKVFWNNQLDKYYTEKRIFVIR
jgi:hypothetical protein